MNNIQVNYKFLHPNAKIPTRGSEYAAGLDLYCVEQIGLYTGNVTKCRTGIALEIPVGYEGQIRSRSSLASKGIIIPNSPATIDSDYRGELIVLMYYILDNGPYFLQAGDRIAQLVIAPVLQVSLVNVDELSRSGRGAGGFGSTGK